MAFCIWDYWLNNLNPIEILLGFIFGILASYIYALSTEKIRTNKVTKRYYPLTGKYIRYWKESKELSKELIFAEAILKQITENKFYIDVKTFLEYGENNPFAGQSYPEESIEQWTGEVTMNSLRNGVITWEQRNPDNMNGGFKRLILNETLDKLTIVGETGYGFWLERFTEKINLETNNE